MTEPLTFIIPWPPVPTDCSGPEVAEHVKRALEQHDNELIRSLQAR